MKYTKMSPAERTMIEKQKIAELEMNKNKTVITQLMEKAQSVHPNSEDFKDVKVKINFIGKNGS